MEKFLTEYQFEAITNAIRSELEIAADGAGVTLDYGLLDILLAPVRRFVKEIRIPVTPLCAARGLDAAEEYLKMRGYDIVERELICDSEEIDFSGDPILIAEGEGTLVFVEVKTRNMTDEGMPDEAITEEKRRRFENIAASYMAQHREIDECAVRFDIIGILVASDHKSMIRHHINAFC